MPGELNVAAVSSRVNLISGRFPEPVPIRSPIWYLTRYTFLNRPTWINIYYNRANSGNVKPVLLWSYCWKPKISSERWVNNFSFRALRAEPSAALTLWNHRPCYIICIHVFYLVSATVNPDTHTVPLSQGEFACGTADLILIEAGHQFSAHFDVRASVAPLLIVIWRRKDCDNLDRKTPTRYFLRQIFFTFHRDTRRLPVHRDTAHNPLVCTRGIGWAAAVRVGAAAFG